MQICLWLTAYLNALFKATLRDGQVQIPENVLCNSKGYRTKAPRSVSDIMTDTVSLTNNAA
jgi:hypothetical protein